VHVYCLTDLEKKGECNRHTLKDPVSIVSELLSSITIVSIKWLIRYENKEGGVLSDAEDFNLGK
jgi:hypothetical protein